MATLREAGSNLELFGALPPQNEGCRTTVIIPVRDEADGIERTLAALAGQVGVHGRLLSSRCYEVLLLVNNGRDDTAAVARSFARQHPALPLHITEVWLPPAEANVSPVVHPCKRCRDRRGEAESDEGVGPAAPAVRCGTQIERVEEEGAGPGSERPDDQGGVEAIAERRAVETVLHPLHRRPGPEEPLRASLHRLREPIQPGSAPEGAGDCGRLGRHGEALSRMALILRAD